MFKNINEYQEPTILCNIVCYVTYCSPCLPCHIRKLAQWSWKNFTVTSPDTFIIFPFIDRIGEPQPSSRILPLASQSYPWLNWMPCWILVWFCSIHPSHFVICLIGVKKIFYFRVLSPILIRDPQMS